MLALSKAFSGWTLTELRSLTPRERKNWIEVAKNYRKIVED